MRLIKFLGVPVLLVLALSVGVTSSTLAQGPSKLRVIEVKGGRLPIGMSGKDITGPIVLMTDGKFPATFSEEYLIKINATVLSVKSGEELPRIITQSQKQQFLQWGISEEKVEKAGYIIVNDEVITRGKAEIDRLIRDKLRETPNGAQPQQGAPCVSWTNVYEAWPPGSNNVGSYAGQWCSLPGLLRERGETFDWDFLIVVWSGDQTGWGWSHSIGGVVPGVDGHWYSLTAWYWYQGMLWYVGYDTMQL